MPESRIISTITEINLVGTNISIKTLYQTELPDTIEAFIADGVGNKNGTNYIDGELIITCKNSPQNLNYFIDNNGYLILMINTEDGSQYDIDDNGDLIYTIN